MNKTPSENRKKPVKKQRKLLFQTGAILVPLFLIMLLLVAQTMYRSTINGYLKAQRSRMKDQLKLSFEASFYVTGELPEEDGFFLDFCEKYPKECLLPTTTEEAVANDEYFEKQNCPWGLEWLENAPEIVQLFCAKVRIQSLQNGLQYCGKEYDIDNSFVMDINEPHKGFIFGSYNDDGSGVSYAETLEYSLSDHPALKSLLSDPSDRIEFEKIRNFPEKGSFYIAFKPIMYNGSIRAVMGIAYSWDGLQNAMSGIIFNAFLVGVGGLIVSILILLFLLYRKAIAPAKKIQQGIQTYIRTKDSAAVTDKLSSIKVKNELGTLSQDLSEMVREIDHYTEENVRMAEEREKAKTELHLASRIQDAMLPKDFPEHEAFTLSASMTPALAVGGDFYDFFFLDEEHLALVIADVSGKGIPAALFMMMCKNMIKNFAREGLSPSQILDRANRNILENKQNSMFVTVWIGIYEISTGHITAANGGHEYPMIRKAAGDFVLFKDPHSFIVGGIKKVVFKTYEFDLEKGGTLFLYTDGAAEATNSKYELFGTKRMLQALNQAPDSSPEDLIKNMQAAIEDFVGDAPQYDDLTMLVIQR